MNTKLTFEIANELLRLDTETGKLYWRERDRKWFSSALSWKVWNKRFAEKEALTTNNDGYLAGRILLQTYYAHRIVWLLHTGSWPTKGIDHINGDRTYNRPDNLRDVSQAENNRNHRMKIINTSGVQGVHWRKDVQKWRARIKVSGKDVSLGQFDSFNEAVACRRVAEREHGFHENHGRAA